MSAPGNLAQAIYEDLRWIEAFADVRAKDDSKVFARVNRGALRTIRQRAADAAQRMLDAKVQS